MQEHKDDSVREAWILCLILGMVMINFPFVHIFNDNQLIFGIPKLVLYFLIGWPASIAVIWLFIVKTVKEEQNGSSLNNDQNSETG